MTCSGAPAETCGGSNRLDIYSYGSATATTTAALPTATGWNFLGCYTDNIYARTLMNAVQVPGGKSTMTIELCEATCKSAGYALAGVEYSGECCKLYILYTLPSK
jgi:glucan 1,3-beta-glucosidase